MSKRLFGRPPLKQNPFRTKSIGSWINTFGQDTILQLANPLLAEISTIAAALDYCRLWCSTGPSLPPMPNWTEAAGMFNLARELGHNGPGDSTRGSWRSYSPVTSGALLAASESQAPSSRTMEMRVSQEARAGAACIRRR
jgi:hypothetical protein